MRTAVLGLMLLTLAACGQKSDSDVASTAIGEEQVFTLRSGCHYADPGCSNPDYLGSVQVTGTTMTRGFLFDSSAQYATIDPAQQADINKLFGFTDCGALDPQTNSARIGWRWYAGQLELHAFVHANSVMQSALLGTIAIGTRGDASITVDGNQYRFVYQGQTATLPRGCSGAQYNGWLLKPYFGGTETAPHTISIRLY
jgi:hypothetical protein